jgi:large subunit ribosomal protein L13
MDYIIDATNERVGRLASRIAVALQGKGAATYEPNRAGTLRVVVRNASKMEVTGNKGTQKIYYRHTGYMGHLRKRTFKEAFNVSPEAVLKKAVFNMLPKNRLRTPRLKRLIIES